MTDKPAPFVFPIRVYYEDTDAGGIVYHANYIKFAERGRTEWLRATGFDHDHIMKEFGLLLVVKHMDIDFKMPAKLDNLLEVHTFIENIGNTSIAMKQDIVRDHKIVACLQVTIVAVNAQGRPERIPPQLRQIFEAQEP